MKKYFFIILIVTLSIASNDQSQTKDPNSTSTSSDLAKESNTPKESNTTKATLSTTKPKAFKNVKKLAPKDAMNLDAIIVDDNYDRDLKAQDNVFESDQVLLYKGKKEIELFRGSSVADLLSGFEGVFSGEARNGGAIDPNIRGIQGQGRIPVMVDNSEQSVVIWRGLAGISNRNYLDPSLIAGISIQKGPALDRDMRGGVGGSIAMRTIDATDIVKRGQKYGVEIRLETATNSMKERSDVYSEFMGKDYRDLGVKGGQFTLGEFRLQFGSDDWLEQRKGGRYKPFKDNAARIAIATKQDNFDSMLAYAYRKKGNYYSGAKAHGKYGVGKTVEDLNITENKDYPADPWIPWIAAVYYPGYEVPNTHMQTNSWLYKGNYIKDAHKTSLALRLTKIRNGEIMPSALVRVVTSLGSVTEWPTAHTDQQSISLTHTYKPDNPLVDLKLSLWAVKNDSTTNSSGGQPGDTWFSDEQYSRAFNDYMTCKGQENPTSSCKAKYGNNLENPPPKTPGLDKELFIVRPSQAQYTKDDHYGIGISNLAQINDNLDLSLMANYKGETLHAQNEFKLYSHLEAEKINVWGEPDKIYPTSGLPYSEEKKGKRQEINLGANLNFRPPIFDWLVLNAGLRYTQYESVDEGGQEKALWAKKQKNNFVYIAGMNIRVSRLATQKDIDKKTKIENKPYNKQTVEERQYLYYWRDQPAGYINDTFLWSIDKYGRYSASNHPMNDGRIAKILQDPTKKEKNLMTEAMDYKVRYINLLTHQNDTNLAKKQVTSDMFDKLEDSKRSANALSPSFGATAFVGNYTRIYSRLNQVTRMPSIYEDTPYFRVHSMGKYNTIINPKYDRKPEIGTNFELGIVQDLRFFLDAKRADIKLNYFRNKTQNIFDREPRVETVQFDERTMEGLELQGRYDIDKFYMNFGVSHSIKNELCDDGETLSQRLGSQTFHYQATFRGSTDKERIKNAKRLFEIFNKKHIPRCVSGGSANGYLKNTVPPDYSANVNIGLRLFAKKLELGARGQYHSKVTKSREKSLMDAGFEPESIASMYGSAIRWEPIFVFDAFARYAINQDFSFEFSAMNITDLYYLDPMTRSAMPAPGRTFRLALAARF